MGDLFWSKCHAFIELLPWKHLFWVKNLIILILGVIIQLQFVMSMWHKANTLIMLNKQLFELISKKYSLLASLMHHVSFHYDLALWDQALTEISRARLRKSAHLW